MTVPLTSVVNSLCRDVFQWKITKLYIHLHFQNQLQKVTSGGKKVSYEEETVFFCFTIVTFIQPRKNNHINFILSSFWHLSLWINVSP